MNFPIVVGVDGSEAGLEAARWAALDAALHRVPVRLLSVVSLGPMAGLTGSAVPEHVYTAVDDRAREHLAAAAEVVFQTQGCQEIEQEVRHGHPAWILVDESAHARRVVVGSQGLGERTGHGLGSTAEALVAHARCPVVVARGSGAPQRSELPVVVGVDGSRIGDAAVEAAFEEASVREVPLAAVHTWNDVASGDLFAADTGLDWDSVERHENAVLAERLAGWQEKYPDVRLWRVVERDRPVRCLIEHGGRAQLIVVGSRGRGGFTGMLLGSTSRSLVHSAPCPLMVVRYQEH
ncbi:universal stress protein [Parasphingorhabdus pacifica]